MPRNAVFPETSGALLGRHSLLMKESSRATHMFVLNRIIQPFPVTLAAIFEIEARHVRTQAGRVITLRGSRRWTLLDVIAELHGAL